MEKRVNYTNYEKDVLLSLVEEREILLDKATCKFKNKAKEEAWADVCRVFNADERTRCVDDWTKLRGLYKNLKAKAQKENTNLRKEVTKTGGGRPAITEVSAITQRILAMEPCQFEPLQSRTDSEKSTLPNMVPRTSLETPICDEDSVLLLPCTKTAHDDSVELNDSMAARPVTHEDVVIQLFASDTTDCDPESLVQSPNSGRPTHDNVGSQLPAFSPMSQTVNCSNSEHAAKRVFGDATNLSVPKKRRRQDSYSQEDSELSEIYRLQKLLLQQKLEKERLQRELLQKKIYLTDLKIEHQKKA